MPVIGLRLVALHVDDARQFGPPGEAEEMAFFRDSEGNLVGLGGRR